MNTYKYLIISTMKKSEISANTFDEAEKKVFDELVSDGFFEGKITSFETSVGKDFLVYSSSDKNEKLYKENFGAPKNYNVIYPILLEQKVYALNGTTVLIGPVKGVNYENNTVTILNQTGMLNELPRERIYTIEQIKDSEPGESKEIDTLKTLLETIQKFTLNN